MAKQGFDYKRLLLASLLTVGVGVVLAILSLILQLLSLVITGEYANYVHMASTAYSLLLIPGFLALFFWAGMRAAKNFGFDPVGAGAVSAFSYFIVSLVQLVLGLVLAAVIVTRPAGGGAFGTPEMALASTLFGSFMGLSGVALSAVCGFGIIAVGCLINFVIGGFGGLFALRGQSGSG